MPSPVDLRLSTLERLTAIEAPDLRVALQQASQLIAEALATEKVDAFMLDPASATLVALGTSDTPLGRKQKALGLDRVALANGGSAAHTFQTGEPYLCGDVQADESETLGVREGLGVQSSVAVVIEVGERRGVLQISSLQRDRFDEHDLRFVEAVARWLGILIHRTELVARIAREAASQARKVAAEEIVTILAHDLRNYLAAIHGRLGLLSARGRRDGRTQDHGDAEQALKVLARLRSMVSDMLDLGRLGQGSLTVVPEPIDLVVLVHETVELVRTPTIEIAVSGPESMIVPGDPLRLRQVIENLLGNAIKHSPGRTPILVMLGEHQRGAEGLATVSIKDSGPGIDPAVLPRLFERFTTGPGSSGLGLGLYIARGITEAHGGTLTVESTPGLGTTFTVALPLMTRS